MMPASKRLASCLAVSLLLAAPVRAQTVTNMAALRGLAPVAALPDTEEGRAALAANLRVTAAIQDGTAGPPTLLPFPEQQRQALRDAFITGWNATQLADGLGDRLGPAYQARARYESPHDHTNISPAVAALIAYSNETTAADSNSGKYFFANRTIDGRKPVSPNAAALIGADAVDTYGKAYGYPAGSPDSNPYGNPRPFQTEPQLTRFDGPDYFGTPSNNLVHLRGPAQDLTESPAYPSGHTTYGTMESVLLAILVPERYGQEIARGAEYGNDRIILGAHYAMDVIAGRTLALHDVAHLLANDPAYVGQAKTRGTIADYPAALQAARAELRPILSEGCGDTVPACAVSGGDRFRDPAANAALVEATLTYSLPVVHGRTAGVVEKVGEVAPEAGHLLTAAFPYLSLAQANDILTETEGPGGGFLDDGSAFGLYSRLNLFAAAQKAAALAPAK